MIVGLVDVALEPTVTLSLRGPSSRSRVLPFIVDTGYSGHVSLPPSLVAELELQWIQSDRAILADGSVIEYDRFVATIDWDGTDTVIEVDQSDSPPLLGTKLLRGYELTAQMRPHGKLTLKKLPPRKRKVRS